MITKNFSDSPDLFIWGGDAVYTDKLYSFLMDDEDGYNSIEYIYDRFKEAKDSYPYYNQI